MQCTARGDPGKPDRRSLADFAGRDDPAYGAYWEALSQARIGDAL